MGEKFTVGQFFVCLVQFLILITAVTVIVSFMGCNSVPTPEIHECLITIGTAEFRDSIDPCLKTDSPRTCILDAYQHFHVADCRYLPDGTESSIGIGSFDGTYLTTAEDRATLLNWSQRWCSGK